MHSAIIVQIIDHPVHKHRDSQSFVVISAKIIISDCPCVSKLGTHV